MQESEQTGGQPFFVRLSESCAELGRAPQLVLNTEKTYRYVPDLQPLPEALHPRTTPLRSGMMENAR